MAVTSNTFTGDGTDDKPYSFTFEYLEQDEVKVTLNGVPTTAFTFANATSLIFDPTPAEGTEIRIYRDTNIDDLKATFFPGSAIKAEDLNNNFTQNNFVVQEIQNNTWDRERETIHSDEDWVSSDGQLATTAAIDARFQDEVGDTIESTETWVSDDDHIPTTAAADDQYTTLVQLTTPQGLNYPVGKTWLQNDADLTLSIWNGSGWIGIASGGTFTNLPKVVYVDSVNGNDINEGHRISGPKKTIKSAIEQINGDDTYGDGSVVLLAPGIYGEQFPIDIQKKDVSIIGTALRNCIIHPAIPEADQASYDVNTPHANELSTMFRVNSGTYISNLTMTGMKASGTRGGNPLDDDTTTGLPTNQGWNVAFYPGARILKSPYIQNCTNFSDSRINNVIFTPHIPGQGAAGDLDSDPTGGGILINGATVASDSPLRSMVCDSYTHTALDGPGIFVTNNGYCQATSSYAFFCHYHLKAKNGGQANLAASTSDFGRYSLIADGRSTSPIFTASTVGSANQNSTTFTISAPTGNWHGTANRPQNNMVVDVGGNTYPILSSVANGSGWDVTISRPNSEDLSENLGLLNTVNSGSPVTFYLRSMIASSGHTMEYVGSGTNYSALPENGGVPDDSKQLIEQGSGKIWAAVTDHKGTFKVGDTFSVDQQSGFITFGTGSFAIPTLLVDLNLNGNQIVTSNNGDITLNPDGFGTIDVSDSRIRNVADPAEDTDAANQQYVNNRIISLVDEIGGFIAIANENSFPTTNPDINNNAGTIVSIAAITTARTPVSGTVTITNGSGINTVTINNCGTTVLPAGFGVLVETTDTLHTYNFHRLVPKAGDVSTVAGSISNVNTVGGSIANVNTVANDLNETVSEINTVATNITNVNTVGTYISNVNTVAGDLNEPVSEINTVANNISNVNTVGDNIVKVNVVGGSISQVQTVADDLNATPSKINTVSTDITNVNTVAGSITNVNTVATGITNVNTVAADLNEPISEINTVATDITNVNTVGNGITNVNTVATNIANVNTVAGISSNVTTVANNDANITTVAGINTAITTVAAKATEIGRLGTAAAVADMEILGTAEVVADMAILGTNDVVNDMDTLATATNVDAMYVCASAISNINNAALNEANINLVAGSISNVNTVATNISGINDFAQRYRIGATDPTTDNDAGDLFYNTTDNKLKRWDGSSWVTLPDLSGLTSTTATHLGYDAGLDFDFNAQPSAFNTAIGSYALSNNIDSTQNTAVGYHACLSQNSGSGSNSAVGAYTLASNQGGGFNAAFGSNAMRFSSGSFSTALGQSALYNNSGTFNIGVGATALYTGTGSYNTGCGKAALYSLNIGNYNTALGDEAGHNITDGDRNILIGSNAGKGITTGDYNVVLGSVTGLPTDLVNTVIVGDGQGNERFRVDSNGYMGIGRTDPAGKLDLNGPFVGSINSDSVSTLNYSHGNYFVRSVITTVFVNWVFPVVPTDRVYSFTLELTVNNSPILNWPTAVKWPADTAPTLTNGKTHLLVFITDDAGTTWRGAAITDYTT